MQTEEVEIEQYNKLKGSSTLEINNKDTQEREIIDKIEKRSRFYYTINNRFINNKTISRKIKL